MVVAAAAAACSINTARILSIRQSLNYVTLAARILCMCVSVCVFVCVCVCVCAAEPVWTFPTPVDDRTELWRQPEPRFSVKICPQKLQNPGSPLFHAVKGDTTSTLSAIRSARLDLNRAARTVTASTTSRVKGAAILVRECAAPFLGVARMSEHRQYNQTFITYYYC